MGAWPYCCQPPKAPPTRTGPSPCPEAHPHDHTAQHLTAYRRELLEGGLDFELVTELVKTAALTLVANEGLRTLAPTPIRFVVCAATTAQAQQWVAKHNLYPRQVVIPNDPRTLLGLTDFAVVTLPGFEGRPDAQPSTDALMAMQQGSDFVDQHTDQALITSTPGPH